MKISMIFFLSVFFLFPAGIHAQPGPSDDLRFSDLAHRWDEAMPLGNGMLGALVWQKDKKLRLSLDRADLWDERRALDISKLTFKWVHSRVVQQDYDTVHVLGDEPYDNVVYPTKLPAGAVEFDISALGKVISNVLDIRTALNTVRFQSGAVFTCYVHAARQQGYFSFENITSQQAQRLAPELIIPAYTGSATVENDNSHAGEGLQKLGYKQGTIIKSGYSILYHQPVYDGHYYEVRIEWKIADGNKITGTWAISNDRPVQKDLLPAKSKEPAAWQEHVNWWTAFWSKSSVTIPDSLLQRQYRMEMYKLGSVARAGAPAITLQAVWTADNGSLPPWKGDFHNDLNTQLSYWPAYTANHLQEAATYTDWLWKTRKKNEQFTRRYFETDGLNVPGVETISGDPMGGWIQYSLSPTTGAWCAQHFYWQWKYSMDEVFLKQQAYPYIHAVAVYLENNTFLEKGVRRILLSSSPEYHDNSIKAWFTDWTNYDLSLVTFLFTAAAEVADANGRKEEAAHWREIVKQLPPMDTNGTGLTVAPGQNLDYSHRHFSPYMAIYPLALLDMRRSQDSVVIENSIRHLEEKGTRAWCGYSFSWMACIYARAHKAADAVKQLQIFASHFCSLNSFHLNGDQHGGRYSDFTYRPFTLEGNFAFAQGVQELLLQSKAGYIEIFPAVPDAWQDVSFSDLRAEGAFMVSAEKKDGVVRRVKVLAEKNGRLRIRLPFKPFVSKGGTATPVTSADGITSLYLRASQSVIFENRDN